MLQVSYCGGQVGNKANATIDSLAYRSVDNQARRSQRPLQELCGEQLICDEPIDPEVCGGMGGPRVPQRAMAVLWRNGSG